MTKEEYRSHLLEVIKMVFAAEHNLHTKNPDLEDKLRSHNISPDDYLNLVADEILNNTDDSIYENFDNV